jgi:hypothetical protein
MTRNLKVALFFLASGALALSSGGCGGRWFMQLLGDLSADTFFLRGID